MSLDQFAHPHDGESVEGSSARLPFVRRNRLPISTPIKGHGMYSILGPEADSPPSAHRRKWRSR